MPDIEETLGRWAGFGFSCKGRKKLWKDSDGGVVCSGARNPSPDFSG